MPAALTALLLAAALVRLDDREPQHAPLGAPFEERDDLVWTSSGEGARGRAECVRRCCYNDLMDAARIQAICDRLRQDTGATLTMVVQANGRLIANCGDPAGMDGDALKLLARSDADVANLLSDQECVVLQPNQNLVMRLLAGGPIVLVIFAAASSLERVRELTREAAEQMEAA